MNRSALLRANQLAEELPFVAGAGRGGYLTIIRTIVEQHVEGAASLWLLRSVAVKEPHYDLSKDLTRLDDRLEAHLDGLRIAGEAAWDICRAALEAGEAGEAFAAGTLAFESGDAPRLTEILSVLEKVPEAGPGLVSAMGWVPFDRVGNHLWKLQTSSVPALRYVGIAAAAVHREDPGPALKDALKAEEPRLAARAFKAAGELGRTDLAAFFWPGYSHTDRRVRFWAGWAGALLGDMNSIDVLKRLVEEQGRYRDESAGMALRRMDVEERKGWHGELVRNPACLRQAAIGTGVIGEPALVPWLIEKMAVDDVARVAGEALTMITGVDIAYLDLERNRPEGFESGPTENPEDEDVAMDPDENLPWPDPALIEKWWASHASEFKPGQRYLVGKPITPENLQWVLRHGRQRQRAAAAIELALLDPGAPLFEVRAPAARQKRLLGL